MQSCLSYAMLSKMLILLLHCSQHSSILAVIGLTLTNINVKIKAFVQSCLSYAMLSKMLILLLHCSQHSEYTCSNRINIDQYKCQDKGICAKLLIICNVEQNVNLIVALQSAIGLTLTNIDVKIKTFVHCCLS